MPTDPLSKVTPGDPLRITAEAYNAFVEAARAERERRFDGGAVAGEVGKNTGIIKVRNDSGSDLARFSVVALRDPLVTPTESLGEFHRQVALGAAAPASTDAGRFAVLLETAAAGAIVRAVVSGVVACQVQVDPVWDYQCADVQAGVTDRLVAGASPGAAQILWHEPGTGVRWAVVRLGPACGPPVPQSSSSSSSGSASSSASGSGSSSASGSGSGSGSGSTSGSGSASQSGSGSGSGSQGSQSSASGSGSQGSQSSASGSGSQGSQSSGSPSGSGSNSSLGPCQSFFSVVGAVELDCTGGTVTLRQRIDVVTWDPLQGCWTVTYGAMTDAGACVNCCQSGGNSSSSGSIVSSPGGA